MNNYFKLHSIPYNAHLTDPQHDYHVLNNKSSFLKTVIKTIYLLMIDYFVEGKYLCRFYRKTGTTLAFFVDSKDSADEYRTWYLSETDMSAKTIQISENRAIRLMKEDIEEFEYRKVTNIQRSIIDPVLAFLKQPCISYLSFRSILIFSVLIVGIVGGFCYFDGSYPFIGNGSMSTFISIFNTATSAVNTLLVICLIMIVSSGVISIKRSLNNYYIGAYTNRRTIGQQLIIFALVPICFRILIEPSIMKLVNVLQGHGYFLP